MSKAESYDWVDVENVSTTLFTQEPKLSIYRDGSGNINAPADYRWFADVDGFVRRADPDERVLGFIPSEGDDVRQITREDDYGGTVGLQKALKILGIDAGQLDETYFTPLEMHDGIVVADLSDLTDTAADTRTGDRAPDATPSDADNEADDEDEKAEYECRHCHGSFDSERGRNIHEGQMHADDEAADHGGTEVPDPEDVPSHETVRDCADGVDTVQELADLLDVDVGEARFLARDADVYADLRDNPPRPGVSRQ